MENVLSNFSAKEPSGTNGQQPVIKEGGTLQNDRMNGNHESDDEPELQIDEKPVIT